MENKGHKFTVKKGKFNLIDIFIILFVSVILIATLSYFFSLFWIVPDQEDGTLTYTVMFEGLSTDVEYTLLDEKSVKNYKNDLYLGEKVKMKTETYSVVDNGEEKIYKRITLSVKVDCTYKKDVGYLVNGNHFKIGEQIPVIIQVGDVSETLKGHCIGLTYSAGGE